MGLYLEEFVLGESRMSHGRTIGEGDITTHAGLVGDWNPLHVDEEFCRDTPFGTRVAHGPLVMSVAIGLMSQMNWIDGTTLGLLEVGWTFSGPVRIGDTVRAHVTPRSARPTKDGARGVLVLGFEVINQRDETVQTGSITLMMRRRPAA